MVVRRAGGGYGSEGVAVRWWFRRLHPLMHNGSDHAVRATTPLEYYVKGTSRLGTNHCCELMDGHCVAIREW